MEEVMLNLLLDISKAFDHVEYTSLFETLKNRGKNSVILRCLNDMYTNQTCESLGMEIIQIFL